MYGIKLFTDPNPCDVQDQANEWLKHRSELNCIRQVEFSTTDAVYFSANVGIQRYTLVIAYEIPETRDGVQHGAHG